MPLHPRTNRLITETSPYLLQHAENPVDWYPWGDAAFEKAKAENKPVLLSIGYSACHWCHVMAHESFEDEAIAALMNEHFVNIKVDREERPDLDQIYQTVVQFFIKRAGGWPLTVFMTPEKIPFYGGTYFPPEDRHRLPGFPKILQSIAGTYRQKPEEIAKTVQDVERAIRQLREVQASQTSSAVDPDLLMKSADALCENFDHTHGGFGSAPKFPGVPALHLLLRYYQQSGDKDYLDRVCFTLGKMAWGGIYDQLGGGFHRYSVDEKWRVPHFEKMLYDNAQLASLYFAACQATGEAFYKTVGIEILDYVLREMTDPEGGFYSAEDADSEGGEGLYYLWTPLEVQALLEKTDAALFCSYYNMTETGNFEGKNILHLTRPLDDLAKALEMPLEEALQGIRSAKEKLLQARGRRPKPLRDDKIIVSWSSLMISAFVSGYQVTRNPAYLATAEKGAAFIRSQLYYSGRLLHTFKDGVGKLEAYLDDYSFFIMALLSLYEATGTPQYLSDARSLAAVLSAQFLDKERGGFYYTSDAHEVLIDRVKPAYDQSIPSGNALAAELFLRLFYLTGERSYFEIGEQTLQRFGGEMAASPFGTGNLIAAADFYLRPPKEIHLIGDPDAPETEVLLSKLYSLYLPNSIIVLNHVQRADAFNQGEWLRVDGKPTVYLCEQFTCSPALTAWNEIRAALGV